MGLSCLWRTRTPEKIRFCPADVLGPGGYRNELVRGYRDEATRLGFEGGLRTCTPYAREVGRRDGKGVLSRGVHVDTTADEKDAGKVGLDEVVNALHEVLRLKKLSTEAPERGRDVKPYTRSMSYSKSNVCPSRTSLLGVADMGLLQNYCTSKVVEVPEMSRRPLSVETILDGSGFTCVSERLVQRLKAHFPGEQQLLNT